MVTIDIQDFTDKNQEALKDIMRFMVDNAIVKIQRWGEDMELSLHYVDDTVYAIDFESVLRPHTKTKKVNKNGRT